MIGVDVCWPTNYAIFIIFFSVLNFRFFLRTQQATTCPTPGVRFCIFFLLKKRAKGERERERVKENKRHDRALVGELNEGKRESEMGCKQAIRFLAGENSISTHAHMHVNNDRHSRGEIKPQQLPLKSARVNIYSRMRRCWIKSLSSITWWRDFINRDCTQPVYTRCNSLRK